MLQPLLLLLLVLVLGYCQDSQTLEDDSGWDHYKANIEKMGELRARWDRRHPVHTAAVVDAKKNHSVPTIQDANHIPSILEINGDDAAKLIQGDIMPSDEDIAEMEERLQEDETGESRPKRAASDKSAPNWPAGEPIPFSISASYNDAQKDMIRTALKRIEANTCVFFEETGSGPRLVYAHNGGGCVSPLGDRRYGYRNQPLTLGDECFDVPTIIHETIHALGFGHTQTRSDREEYVKIMFEDIPAKYIHNFDILHPSQFDDHSVPYEYNSIMHYDSMSASIDQKTPVIIPKDDDYIASIGGNLGATFNDWKQINIRYNCRGNCSKDIPCLNKGYQNPHDCNSCSCPTFYTGSLCDKEVNLHELKPGMEESLTLEFFQKGKGGLVQIDKDFANFKKELRLIKAPEGHRINISIDKILLGNEDCQRECERAALEIVDGDLSIVGKRFCCPKKTGHSFISSSNVVGYQAYSMPQWPFLSRVTFSLIPPGAETTMLPAEDSQTSSSAQSDSTTSEAESEQDSESPTDQQVTVGFTVAEAQQTTIIESESGDPETSSESSELTENDQTEDSAEDPTTSTIEQDV